MAPIQSFFTKFAETAFVLSASSYQQPTQKGPSISVGTNAIAPIGTSSLTSSSDTTDVSSSYNLSEMCHLFQASPIDSLYLSSLSGGEGGGRGVRLYRSVKKGDVILSIPISSCFRDDEPPSC